MRFCTLDDVNVRSKRVLLRVDLNIPMNNGQVIDMTRIKRSSTTIKELSQKGARVILLAHFGQPKGVTARNSLKRIVSLMESELDRFIRFSEDCIGDKAKSAISAMQDGEILLLENTRFHAGEERNDQEFAKALASNGDIYVNDAFSVAHRAHASTEGVARFLPSYAGRLMQTELEALEKSLGCKKRCPVMAIVGGAKVSSKISLLYNLVEKVNVLAIGGGMANTFLAAQGLNIGNSLCEPELANTALAVMEKAIEENCQIILPIDVVVAYHFKAHAVNQHYDVASVPLDGMILDIGIRSIERIRVAIDDAATLVWNGPLGAFELCPFDQGTVSTAEWAANCTRLGNLISVAGGGDTVAALAHAGVSEDFTYLSTGGGAFLEWMEGKLLPGVAALDQSNPKIDIAQPTRTTG